MTSHNKSKLEINSDANIYLRGAWSSYSCGTWNSCIRKTAIFYLYMIKGRSHYARSHRSAPVRNAAFTLCGSARCGRERIRASCERRVRSRRTRACRPIMCGPLHLPTEPRVMFGKMADRRSNIPSTVMTLTCCKWSGSATWTVILFSSCWCVYAE